MNHEKTYLRYPVLPLHKQLKGGYKNYDIFDKTPNFGSEKSFQLKSKITNFDDLNQDYNKNYDVYSKVSRNKFTNTNINPIYPQYNLLLPKIRVTFKKTGESNILVQKDQEITKENIEKDTELHGLIKELILLDNYAEGLDPNNHESIEDYFKKIRNEDKHNQMAFMYAAPLGGYAGGIPGLITALTTGIGGIAMPFGFGGGIAIATYIAYKLYKSKSNKIFGKYRNIKDLKELTKEEIKKRRNKIKNLRDQLKIEKERNDELKSAGKNSYDAPVDQVPGRKPLLNEFTLKAPISRGNVIVKTSKKGNVFIDGWNNWKPPADERLYKGIMINRINGVDLPPLYRRQHFVDLYNMEKNKAKESGVGFELTFSDTPNYT